MKVSVREGRDCFSLVEVLIWRDYLIGRSLIEALMRVLSHPYIGRAWRESTPPMAVQHR